jgi:hypothetical protein
LGTDAAFLRFNVPGTRQAKIYTKNGDNVVAATPEAQASFQSAGFTEVVDVSGYMGANSAPAYLFTSQYDYDSVSNVIPYKLHWNSAINDNLTTATAGGWVSANPSYTMVGLQGFGLAPDPSATAFHFSNAFYDGGTACTVGGITMHCCPDGFAMLGANLGTNVFKCASNPLTGPKVLASSTDSGSTWSCGKVNEAGYMLGTVMVGFHAALNTALCQRSTSLAASQLTLGVSAYNDVCTYDGSSMHVCPFISGAPFTSQLGGINQTDNTFKCLSPAYHLPAILSGPSCNPTAYQYLTLDGYDDGPENAVDGNTDGYFWAGSVTHTTGDFPNYWYVDLGANHTVTGVDIYNRTDCCSERLANFSLFHWAPGDPYWMWDMTYTTSTLGVGSVRLDYGSLGLQNPKAQMVLIWKEDANPLSLAEVQVMGH